MNVGKDWIRPLVRTALQICLDEPANSSFSRSKYDCIAGRVEKDLSNFRIPVCPAEYVQVMKFSDKKSPAQGTLSDSFTSIKAIFPRASMEQLDPDNDTGKPQKGAVLKLAKLDVVVSHVSEHVTLYIHDFDVCESIGASIFGTPEEIQKIKEVANLSRAICETQDSANGTGNGDHWVDDMDRNLEPGPVGIRRRQQSPKLSLSQSDNVDPASQAPLATQAPAPEAPRKQAATESTGNPRSREKEHLLSFITKKRNPAESPSRARSRPSQTFSLQGTESTVREYTTAKTAQEREPASGEQASAQLSISTQNHRSQQSDPSPAPAGASCEKPGSVSVSSSKSIKAKRKNGENGVNNPSVASGNVSADRESPYPKKSPNPTSPQKDAPSARNPSRKSSASPNNMHRPRDKHDAGITTTKRKVCETWKDWKRIKRRDVIIPEDQEELIDNPDSWVPPQTGKQMPQAHVPVSLLKQWNEIQGKLLSTKAIEAKEDPGTDDLQSEVSSSRSPVSSQIPPEAWPPSPVRPDHDVVPADSSPPPGLNHDKLSPGPRLKPTEAQADVTSPNAIALQDENDANVSRPADVAEAPPAASQESDDSESEMEISVPRGGALVSSQEQPSTAGEGGLPNPAIPLPSTEGSCHSHASPSRRRRSSRPQSSRSSEDGGHRTTFREPENEANQLPSDVLVPATYGSGDIPSQHRSSGSNQPGSFYHDKPVENQPASQLDSPSSSAPMPGQHDPLKAGVTLSQNHDYAVYVTDKSMSVGDPMDTEEAQVAGTPPGSKRKLNGSETTNPAKLRKVTEESATRSPVTARHSAERKSLSAESRQAYFCGSVADSPGLAIYNSFQNAYPSYEGDINTFKISCQRLQLFCAEGSLKRTLLWDDYVGREPTEYRDYVQRCLRQNTPPTSYNVYFVNNVTAPRFKMRNLSAKRVAAIADDGEIDGGEGQEPQMPNENNHLSLHQPTRQDDSKAGKVSDLEGDNPPLSDHAADHGGSEHGGSHEGSVNSARDASEDVEDDEWYDCDDEMHEIASIQLGEADNRSNAVVNDDDDDDDEHYPSDIDMALEDEETVVVAEEEETPRSKNVHTDASGLSAKYKDVIEIEESDTDSVVYEGAAEISPERDAGKSENEPAKRSEQPARIESGRKGNSPPKANGPLYPPYKPSHPSAETPSAEQDDNRSSRQQWFEDPNTPFKKFARSFAALTGEMDRFRRESSMTRPVEDKDGATCPTRPKDSTDGKMNSMGWQL